MDLGGEVFLEQLLFHFNRGAIQKASDYINPEPALLCVSYFYRKGVISQIRPEPTSFKRSSSA